MDTSGLESFAQNLRTDLLKGVRQRLRYWGFKEDRTVEEAPEKVEGGYVFRGEVHDDPGVPRKWRALKNAINRHDLDHVAEEAAYTWFNRLVAIRILEKNGHRTDVLGYADGTEQPAVLYRAKDGVIDVLDEDGTQDVRDAILGSDDDRAFRQLLIGVCHDSDLLNDVFGRLNDFTELLLPTGLLQPDGVIEELVTTGAISDEDYEQVELIGWLYQFYISEKKDEVYDKSGKFEPEDIPAATQIFTPHWIVRYMVENTIGRQWLDKYPDSDLREEMDYLVEQEDYEPQDPIFDDLSELELFDPAAGSGHILVVGFDLLMEMYRERGYTDREAVAQILTENLKGLEIDRRAAQLARFALLMKAAQYDRRALDRDDLRPEVYAMPEPRDFSTSDLRAYLGDDVFDAHGAEVKEAVDLITKLGQNVGSALKLDLSVDAHDAVAQRLDFWDEKTKSGTIKIGEQELHGVLRNYIRPLLLLTREYPTVAMNPPYLGNRKMNKKVKEYVYDKYPNSRSDLCVVFAEVCINLSSEKGRVGMVNHQNWMFNNSYNKIRKNIIDELSIESLLHLGVGAFQDQGGEIVQANTFVLKMYCNGFSGKGVYYDLTDSRNTLKKRDNFLRGVGKHHSHQSSFNAIPGSPIAYWVKEGTAQTFRAAPSLREYAEPRQGLSTANNQKFLRYWAEVDITSSSLEGRGEESKWIPYNKAGGFKKWYGNNLYFIDWEEDGRKVRNYSGSAIRNEDYQFRESVGWSDIGSKPLGARYNKPGSLYDAVEMSVFPKRDNLFPYITSFLCSAVSNHLIGCMSPGMHYSVGYVGDIPLILDEGLLASVNRKAEDAISITRSDWDSREISWDFTQSPLVRQSAETLKEAYETWMEQATDSFLQLHSKEEELNELFIDLYGLEEELSPRVALEDITILEDELDRDALEDLDHERDDLSESELRQRFLEDDSDEALFQVEVPIRQFLSYGIGVMMGRYRLGHDGLHIAHTNPSTDELAPYDVPVPLSGSAIQETEQFEIDNDAIVPLMGQDSPFSDDAVHRMREVVRLIWGEDTLTENLNFINHAISVGRGRGLKRNYEKTMEEWLVDDFWVWHKSLYSVPYYGKKPIYWLFQSPEDHFQVLVYLHRMDKYTPQRVRQDYLQRYQEYLRREIESLESEGEETLSGDDAKRLDRLREAAADCREYDAILKDVADQQIEIDLDDGVHNNYPKFGNAVAQL